MKKYKFTKKYDWWNEDHHNNRAYLKKVFDAYDPIERLTFLEIGVFEARTSCWLLDNILTLRAKPGMLYLIEPDLPAYGKSNLTQHLGDIILYQEPSLKVLIRLITENLQKFDLIYVDGDHNACGVLQDLVLSWKLLKVGGIMLIDDYEMEAMDPWFYKSHKEFSKDYPGLVFTHPRIAIDSFLSIYRGQYTKIIDNYQIGLKKVTDLG
jgi:hypothetical protein